MVSGKKKIDFLFVNGILTPFISLFLHVALGKPGYTQDWEVFDF